MFPSRLPLAAALLMPLVLPAQAVRPSLPAPLSLPKPAAAASAGQPYTPQAILPGGVVVPLFAPGSKYLKADRIHEAEVYNMSSVVPGRIASIVNIHFPSIEFHPVERGINTGSTIILVAGGGHNTLNVGGEAADFVPYFYNFGINTVILRNRLRRDGYNPRTDAVYDALQAIRLVRAYAKEWNLDPNRIGIMGFSAGAELTSATALQYPEFDKQNSDAATDPLAGVSARPDWVGIIYPGPTPFTRPRGPNAPAEFTPPAIPPNVPPAFLATGGSGDRIHAIWAMDYFSPMLAAGVPNIEMHVYGNGRHPGDALPDGSRMSGGLTDRKGIPMGTWQARFIEWYRDLGFLGQPGVETKAAKDVAGFAANPPRPFGAPAPAAAPR